MSIQSSTLSSNASSGCCSSSSGTQNSKYMDSIMRAADANGDGKVSKSEAKDFFRKADSNGDGKISGEEMLKALLENNGKSQGGQSGAGGAGGCGGGSPAGKNGAGSCGSGAGQSQGAGSDENKLDANGDGNITIDELERFLNSAKNQNQAQRVNKPQSGSMDADGDGSLSLREFMKGMQKSCA